MVFVMVIALVRDSSFPLPNRPQVAIGLRFIGILGQQTPRNGQRLRRGGLTNRGDLRRRVQAILERLRGPVTQAELLQALRAVAVLEDIGTPEAQRLLQELAKGALETRLTREAKESLRRRKLEP
jgi:hypothetical protein